MGGGCPPSWSPKLFALPLVAVFSVCDRSAAPAFLSSPRWCWSSWPPRPRWWRSPCWLRVDGWSAAARGAGRSPWACCWPRRERCWYRSGCCSCPARSTGPGCCPTTSPAGCPIRASTDSARASVVINATGVGLGAAQCWNIDPGSVDADPQRVWSWADPPFLRPYRQLADGRSLGQVRARSATTSERLGPYRSAVTLGPLATSAADIRPSPGDPRWPALSLTSS